MTLFFLVFLAATLFTTLTTSFLLFPSILVMTLPTIHSGELVANPSFYLSYPSSQHEPKVSLIFPPSSRHVLQGGSSDGDDGGDSGVGGDGWLLRAEEALD